MVARCAPGPRAHHRGRSPTHRVEQGGGGSSLCRHSLGARHRLAARVEHGVVVSSRSSTSYYSFTHQISLLLPFSDFPLIELIPDLGFRPWELLLRCTAWLSIPCINFCIWTQISSLINPQSLFFPVFSIYHCSVVLQFLMLY